MFVYRIVKTKGRANDLSGTGSFTYGGRWNSKGTYMLYTSENSSLALLETLVHFDPGEFPPRLFIAQIEVSDTAPVFELPDADYPKNWLKAGLLTNKTWGDRMMRENLHAACKVRSAINRLEFNYLLNPLFADYTKLVKVVSVQELKMDERLR